ncbi:ABC transporter transmembrane domain-containing protein [Roseivivax sp. CAU 1761]
MTLSDTGAGPADLPPPQIFPRPSSSEPKYPGGGGGGPPPLVSPPRFLPTAACLTPGAARWIGPLLRPHLPRLGLLLALGLAAALIGLAPPYLSKLVIDRGLMAGDPAALVHWAAALFAVGLAATGLGALSGILHMRASVRMLADLRAALVSALAVKPPAWFAGQRTGEVMARIDGDAGEVQKFAFNGVLGGVSSAVRLVGGTAMLMVLEWRLGLAAALLAPCELLFLAWARPRTERMAETARAAQGRYAAGLAEAVFGMAALQAARGTGFVEARAASDHARLNRGLVAQFQWAEVTRAVPAILTALLRSGIFVAGGLMVIRGDWPLGSLIAFIAYLGVMTGPMQALLGLWHAQARVRVALARLDAVMDAPCPPRATPAAAPRGHALTLDRVEVALPGGARLGPITLSLPEGARLAVTGPSGAGKTTLLGVLAGRARPAAGRITLGGVEVSTAAGAGALPAGVALVGQRPLILRANLRDNLFAPEGFWDRPGAEAALAGHLEAFGLARRFAGPGALDAVLGENGLTLSGGERQRICLLRVLLRPVRLLILDEALSEVDPATAARLLDHLDAALPGVTRIRTDHRPDAAARPAERVLDLGGGRA